MDLSIRTETYGNDDQSWLGSLHGTQATESVTLDVSAFTLGTHYDRLGGWFKSGIALGLIAATGKYGPYAGNANEVQTVTITGSPTGGTFTLTLGGQTTTGIAFSPTAAVVQAALVALTSVEPGDVTVTGATGGPFTVTFGGRFAGQDVAAMTASGGSLTGGTSPGVTIATTTAGGSAVTDGTAKLVGFLYAAVSAPWDSATDVSGPMLTHGKVRNAKLPVPVDAAGQASVAGSIRFI